MLPRLPQSELLFAIKSFIQSHDQDVRHWYVGINDEPDLTRSEKKWMLTKPDMVLVGRARSRQEAVNIRNYIVYVLGANRGRQPHKENGHFVYAYRLKDRRPTANPKRTRL